jgi:predicted O-linked N-acetylglucosamine transferase (SPINDLY family)
LQSPTLQNALQAHRAGNLAEAARLYSDVLRSEPGNFFALYLFGMLHMETGGRDNAFRLFDAALRANPRFAEAFYQRGNLHMQSGRLEEALANYNDALRLKPDIAEVLNAKGVALTQLGRGEEALEIYARALAVKPGFAAVFNNQGNALLNLQRYEEAAQCYDRALAADPSYPDALNNRSLALYFLGRFEESLASADRFLTVAANHPDGWVNRGLALTALERHAEAMESYGKALALDPHDADVMYHFGNALLLLGRLEDALGIFDRALARKPDAPHGLINRAVILSRLNRHAEALPCFDRALALAPDNTDALYNRANALSVMRRFEDAIADCEKVLAADPDYPYARGVLIHCKLNACDWRGLDQERALIARGLADGERVLNPQQNIAVSVSPADQLRCAQLWVERESPPATPVWQGELYRHERIRVAYLSADYHTHATSFLMAGLFEAHDRSRFEIHGVDFGPDDGSDLRHRVRSAFEHFHDIRGLDDLAAARLLREKEIDIAVDLKGYTEQARTGIFARRPAPVQVNYLGFPGTMGAGYIDYIVADSVLIAPDDDAFYSEKVVRLPHSYQCNDDKRAIGETGTRPGRGLPEHAFVFCCFNASYKIMPEIFGIWMRLLHRVAGSVLWLLHSHEAAVRNLVREAERRGIARERLIFAPRAPLPEHLARQRLADLALDTLPYNAHTTGSDALWAGLPMITLSGSTFAGRVGASLLRAVGLPELVTGGLDDYEKLALHLATDKEALMKLRAKLANQIRTAPLFDTAGFCRDLERAYATMWERSEAGLAPAAFAVAAS